MDIEIIISVLIPIVGAVITYIVWPLIKEITTEKQRNNVLFWVEVAVLAAEKHFNEKGLGEKKKLFVLDFLQTKGMDITIDELDMIIDAVVEEVINNDS